MQKPKYKGFYNMVTNASGKEATIYIYGVIGGFDFDKWEWINTASKFVEDFKELEKTVDLIHVKINSPGGSIWDGLPIYNILKNSTKEIRTYVDGIAYSMASLIALAGDTVYGYPNSLLMFHNGSSYSFGNAKQMRQEADTLDNYDEALGSIIEEKLGITAEEVKEKYLNYNDNYFVGKKAKKIGFFDEIITSKDADVPEDVKNMSPKDLLEHYSKMNFSQPNNKGKTIQPKTTINMDYKNIETVIDAKFEKSETKEGIQLTETQAKAVEAKLISLEEGGAKAVIDKETAEAKLVTMQESVDIDATANTTLVNEVNALLELEGDAEATDVKGAIAALNTKIANLNVGPGATHTKPKKKTTEDNPHAYVDFETPFYKSISNHLN